MSEEPLAADRSAARRVLLLLRFSRFVQSFAYSAAFPFLAIYLTEERGLRASAIGTLYAVLWGVLTLAQAGTLALRRGHELTLAVSLCARGAISVALWALLRVDAPVSLLAAALVVSALLAGLYPAPADGLVLQWAPPSERTPEFARQRVATHLGWILGPVVGGFLYGHASISLLFLAMAPLYTFAGLLLLRGGRGRDVGGRRRAGASSARERWTDKHLALHLTAALLAFSLSGQLGLALALFGTEQLHMSKGQFGAMWTASAVLVVIAQVPATSLMRRRTPYEALVLGALLSGAAYALVGMADVYAQLVLGVLLITAADMIGASAHQEAVSLGVSEDSAGRRVGLVALALTLGRAVGPLLGGVAYEVHREQPSLLWAWMGALWVVAAGLYAGAARHAAVERSAQGPRSRALNRP